MKPSTRRIAVGRILLAVGLVIGLLSAVRAQNPPATRPPAKPATEAAADAIGPTPIRFYSGNMSVGKFVNYWKGRPNGQGGGIDAGQIATLKRTSCRAMCDYISWCAVESEEGKWDWSYYQENARQLAQAGIGYNIFCWLHFPPRWYEESNKFVPYMNLVTGESIPQLSLWSPDLPRVFDEFYRRLAEALGKQTEFVRLAMPSEYGEIGYCTGMTNWLRPQPTAKSGYWCGDPYARADFRKAMLARHGTLEKLNLAWGTTFTSPEAIAMPDPLRTTAADFAATATERRRWTDFIDWYDEAWVGCLTKITGIVGKHLPNRELIASIGYGQEQAYFGNDEGRYIEAMKRLGISCQTPGAIGYFPTRRNSSACRAWGVPYYTEPPASVLPDAELDRIFMDISNGTQTWFDYLGNMDGARPYFRAYKKYLTGAPPRTTLAVWHPTMDHWLHPNDPWSKPALTLADPLRDAAAYEIIDDRMIKAGMLNKLGTHQLVLAGAQWLDRAAWTEVQKWVENGGVLIVLQGKPINDIDGKDDLWQRQAPNGPATLPENSLQTGKFEVPAAYVIDPIESRSISNLLGSWFTPDEAPKKKADPNTRRWAAPGGGVLLPLRADRAYDVAVNANTPAIGAKVTFEIDGKAVGELQPGGPEPVMIKIPADPNANDARADQNRLVRLYFRTEGFVPSKVGKSPDNRLLGAWVHNLVVRETGTADAPLAPPPLLAFTWNTKDFWQKATVLGKGRVLTIETSSLPPNEVAGLTSVLATESGDQVGHPEWNAMKVDGNLDGILCTVFDDKILFYNQTRQASHLDLAFRVSDFPAGKKRPEKMTQTLDLPARTIGAVALK